MLARLWTPSSQPSISEPIQGLPNIMKQLKGPPWFARGLHPLRFIRSIHRADILFSRTAADSRRLIQIRQPRDHRLPASLLPIPAI
jgi:hypothetical protein